MWLRKKSDGGWWMMRLGREAGTSEDVWTNYKPATGTASSVFTGKTSRVPIMNWSGEAGD